MPVQPVDATPLWSFDLTMRFKRPIPWRCSALLPIQDAFSLHLCLWTILSLWNCWTCAVVLVLRRPLETTEIIGNDLTNS